MIGGPHIAFFTALIVGQAPGATSTPTAPAGAVVVDNKAVDNKPKTRSVLVLDLQSSAGIDAATLSTITNRLAVSVQERPRLSVLTNQDVKRMVQMEADKQMLGSCDTTSASCIAEIAGAMGADLVLYGDVGKLGELFVINIHLFDAGQAKSVGRQAVQVTKLDESFLTQLDIAVTSLLAPVTGERTGVTTLPGSGGANVPTIDLDALKASGLKAINMKAELALEAAMEMQNSPTATPEQKRDAWCALAVVDGANAYVEAAQKACDEWKKYVVANQQLEKSLAADYQTLVGFLGLKFKPVEQKLQAIDSFLSTYERIGERAMVKSARAARERLVATGNASLQDNDQDGLPDDVDRCPQGAEDVDTFEDDDGCAEDDNDKDGILDKDDKCPNERGVVEKSGCAETFDDVANKAKNTLGNFFDAAFDFYMFDFDRPVMLGLGARVDTSLSSFGAHLTPGASLTLNYAAFTLGGRAGWDLQRSDGFLAGAHIGLRALQIPRGTFGLLEPSIGVDVMGSPSRGEIVAGPYVSNTTSYSWARLVLSYRYGAYHQGPKDLPDHMVTAELGADASVDDIGRALDGSGGSDMIDVFALDSKREAFIAFTGNAETGLEPFGDRASLGFGLRFAWAAIEFGARFNLDLSGELEVPILMAGNFGLAAIQLPKGDFGLIRPSVGIDGVVDINSEGGAAAGPYVANTFNLDIAQIRVFYRYTALRTGSSRFPTHVLGVELSLDANAIVE